MQPEDSPGFKFLLHFEVYQDYSMLLRHSAVISALISVLTLQGIIPAKTSFTNCFIFVHRNAFCEDADVGRSHHHAEEVSSGAG